MNYKQSMVNSRWSMVHGLWTVVCNRQVGHYVIRFALSLLLLPIVSCQKEKLYEVNEETILPPNANKTKLKSDQQYIAILYANLFQTALSSDDLFEASECVQSIGDKDLVHEVLISNYMNSGGVILPTNAEMRADVDAFLTETYNRFLVRNPTEAERQYFKNYIISTGIVI